MAVLVGGPSTGKSRACWEAIQYLPEGWQLWQPATPGRVGEVLSGLESAPPKTVVWLDETQHYLLKASPERGERIAATLERLLADRTRAPLLVLGTLWPESWAAATTAPPPGMLDGYPITRALLRNTSVHVPSAFNAVERARLLAEAGHDPRLARAAARPDGEVVQFLAGVTAVVEHHRTADPVQEALVNAAIDARRLGHAALIPAALLAAAVPGYLPPGTVLAAEWFEDAVTFACTAPPGGHRGILRRVASPSAEPDACYALADHVLRSGATRRRYLPVPARLWDSALEHGAADDLTAVAVAAQARGLYRHAFRLLVKAADHGNIFALGQAAALLARSSGVTYALPSVRADGAGDPFARTDTGRILESVGQVADAVAAYERAGCAGDHRALTQSANLIERSRHTTAVMPAETPDSDVAHDSASRGDDRDWPPSVSEAAMVEYTTHTDAFADLYTGVDHVVSRVHLLTQAHLYELQGRVEEAVHAYREAAEHGDPLASGRAAALMRDNGRLDEALEWLKTRGSAGDRFALHRTAKLLHEAGRSSDAITRFGIEPDGATAEPWTILAAPPASPRVLEDLDDIQQAFVADQLERAAMTWTVTDDGLFTRTVDTPKAAPSMSRTPPSPPGQWQPRLTARLTQLKARAITGQDVMLDFRLVGDQEHPCPLFLVVIAPQTNATVEPIAADYQLGHEPARFVFAAGEPGRHELRITVYDKAFGTALQTLEAAIDVVSDPIHDGAAA